MGHPLLSRVCHINKRHTIRIIPVFFVFVQSAYIEWIVGWEIVLQMVIVGSQPVKYIELGKFWKIHLL